MNWSARRTATETNVPQRHTHTHTLSEALISRRITRNDNHHGATHPSSSRWRECGHDGGAQRPRETSTGGDAQYRNRATTTARGRAQDRIPVLLQLFNCWLTTCNGALGSQEVCVRLMRGRPPTCARNDNTQRAHTHTDVPTVKIKLEFVSNRAGQKVRMGYANTQWPACGSLCVLAAQQ
jgi:hypothetical protein